MEEHEITEEEFSYASKAMCLDILGKNSLNVLVPYIPDGWNAYDGRIDGGMPANFPSVNLQKNMLPDWTSIFSFPPSFSIDTLLSWSSFDSFTSSKFQ